MCLQNFKVNPFDFFSNLLCTFSDQMIHLVIMLDGEMRHDFLVRALQQAMEAEPITRCRLVEDSDMIWWKINPQITVSNMISLLSAPDPAELLQRVLSINIDPCQGPLVKVIHIQSTKKKGDIIVINVHHTSMDGKGLKDFAGLLFSLYRADRNGIPLEVVPTPMDQRIQPRISSLVVNPDNVHTFSNQIPWSRKFSIPIKSLISEKEVFSLLILNKERVRHIHGIRKEWGVTVNDLMLAVVATACSRIVDGKNDLIHLLNTIDLRRYLKEVPTRTIFNLSTAFEVSIQVLPGEELRDTALRVHHLMSRIKEGTPGIGAVLEAESFYDVGCLKAREEMRLQWNKILDEERRSPLFTNTGIISSEDLDPGVPVSHAFLLPTHNLPPGFCFAISSFREEMTLSSSYALPAFEPELVKTLYHVLDEIIPGYSSYPGTYSVI